MPEQRKHGEQLLIRPQAYDPKAPYLNAGIGVCLEKQGRLADAELFYKKSIDEHVSHSGADCAVMARNNLALLYERSGRNADAERSLKRCLKDSSSSLIRTRKIPVGVCRINSAECLERQERYRDAEPFARRAYELLMKLRNSQSDNGRCCTYPWQGLFRRTPIQ